jgi:hypothetical protein
MCRCIYVFLEGDGDERFFNMILRPMLDCGYAAVVAWQYAQRSKEDVIKALQSVRDGKADYLFLRDIDTCPCVTAGKQDLLERYRNRIDPSRAVVVSREIESWYLAGLDDESRRKLEISPNRHRHTDHLTKEQFVALMPAKFDSVVDFMNEILSRFDVGEAKNRNQSFCYLMDLLENRSRRV